MGGCKYNRQENKKLKKKTQNSFKSHDMSLLFSSDLCVEAIQTVH